MGEPGRGGRWRWALPVGAAGALLVAGAAGVARTSGPDPAPVGPEPAVSAAASPMSPASRTPDGQARFVPPSASTQGSRPPTTRAPALPGADAVRALLAERSRAVLAGDTAGWLRTVDGADPAVVTAQADLFARIALLPVAEWRYALAGPGSAQPGRGERTVPVRLTYRLAGFDARRVVREQELVVVTAPGGRAVVRAAPAPTGAADVWDLGPVQVAQGARSLVVARPPLRGGTAALHALAAEADRAVGAVTARWPGPWPGRVVVVVPADVAEAAALAGRAPAAMQRLAGVTTGLPGPPRAPTAGDRVVLNPVAYAGLTPTGRRVVLTHETVHVATRAAGGGPVPQWLSEGFADEVAYRAAGVPAPAVAEPLLAEVRAGRLPAALPAAAEFAVPGTAYERAWSACRLVVEGHGDSGLVALYAAVQRDGLDRALADVLATTRPGLTAQWRAALVRDAARAPSPAPAPAPAPR